MAKPKEEEKKDKAGLILIPLFGVGAFLVWLFRKKPNPDLAILYGHVTDVETQQGIADINVECNGYTGKTDATGHYSIINIAPGTYGVNFTDPAGHYESLVV